MPPLPLRFGGNEASLIGGVIDESKGEAPPEGGCLALSIGKSGRSEMAENTDSGFDGFLEDGEDAVSGGEGSQAWVQVEPDHDGMRLDLYLADQLGLTRSFAKKLIEEGNVRPLSKRGKAKSGFRVAVGETYEVFVPEPEKLEVEPEPVPFGVLYEDPYLLVIDKPAGVVVHPAPGHWHGTLVHGLLWRYPDIGLTNGVIRPGIVHRLDKMTSGLMVVTRTAESQEQMSEAFRQRRVDKRYLALVKGISPERGEIDCPIGRDRSNRLRMAVDAGGKAAKTTFQRLWACRGCSLVLCRIHTGRTHQIRVHMKHVGLPLVGDALYSRRPDPAVLDRVFLHAWRLAFNHPVTGDPLSFRSPLPEELVRYLQSFLSNGRGR